MKIEIAASVHFFQLRFCWMCSSILQQEGIDLDNIVVNAAYMKGTGNPTTKEVLDFFEDQGLNVKHTAYDDTKELQYRGNVRNRQLAATECDYMLFADADMIYPPDYFRLLFELLEGDYKDNTTCMFSGRNSTFLEETENLINQFEYPSVIPDAFEKSSQLKYQRRSNIGAGYCQIAQVKNLRDNHGGIFVDPGSNRDWSWEKKYQKARSDKQFRRMVGKTKLPLPRQFHLQHIRDNEVGKHVEIQR